MHEVPNSDLLPAGFREAYFQSADLERAFGALRGDRSFIAEAVRGRIRSLQLRFDEAWDHFSRAVELSSKGERGIGSLRRKYLLEALCLDTVLVEAPLDSESEFPLSASPEALRLLGDHPAIDWILRTRRVCDARVLLHLGERVRAARIYEQLIAEHPDTPSADLALYYLDLADCQQGLGLCAEAERNLENAGLATAAVDDKLNAAHLAARLHVLHECLGDLEGAADWKAFLLQLDCPTETKQLLLKRAWRQLEFSV